jgi:adenylate kinase family enzyme
MQRVLVIGCSGTGKSTFARALAGLTGLPVVHIDHLFWQANWIQVPREIYLVRLDQSVAGERWIIDGINTSTLDRRVPRADTIVWLQRSRIVCCWRIIRRVVGSYGQVRPGLS